MSDERSDAVYAYLLQFQRQLCSTFEGDAGSGQFVLDHWQRPGSDQSIGGRGITAVQEQGSIMERAGVALSDVRGTKLPPAATERNPQLAGRSYRAMGVSVVMHPRNPYAPTSHLNVRFFNAGDVWWFGGGFDLTPCLPFAQDCVTWHDAASKACAHFHAALYNHTRAHCDEYFQLKHRGETRGIGGIFYDDLNEQTPQFGMSWEQCFAFMQSVGRHYHDAYQQIIARRHATPYTERERAYQLYRRGRYVEFNLVWDRGTLFGLQSGGRTDAILMSMPAVAHWAYQSPDPDLDAELLPYLTTMKGHNWLTHT